MSCAGENRVSVQPISRVRAVHTTEQHLNSSHFYQPDTIHSNYTSFIISLLLIWNGAAKEWASVATSKSCRGQAKTESAAPWGAQATWKRMTWGPSLLKYAADETPIILPGPSGTLGYDPPSPWVTSKALRPGWGEGGSRAPSTSTTGTSKVLDTTTSSLHDSFERGASAWWTFTQPGWLWWLDTPKLPLASSCAVSEPLQKGLMLKL